MAKPYILCVDDEKIVLDSLKSELKSNFGEEYKIEIAESGEEALDIIKEIYNNNEECHLVISDYIMPEMKGDELLEKIRFIQPSAYKIMLTGQATIEGITNAINNAGLYRYISKPWEINDFIMTIKEALISYKREKQIEMQNFEIKLQNKEIIKKNEEITEINKNLDKLVQIRTQELRNKIDELLKVKIGKKAFIFLFITTLVLFILVDAFLEPILQNLLHDFYILLGIKALIGLMIKPVENYIEKYLYARERKKNVEIISDKL